MGGARADKADLDLTDFSGVDAVVRSLSPEAIIQRAALSRTGDCEEHPDQARLINVTATAHLARLAKDIPFIFLSSAEVFDGMQGWYDEEDPAAQTTGTIGGTIPMGLREA